MIESLNGIHETVIYKKTKFSRLYLNDECEHYPPHWHTEIEILCPIEGGYSVICNYTKYRLEKGDILFICPGAVHELLAEPIGKRIIFLASIEEMRGKGEIETALSRLSPCYFISSKTQPSIYYEVHQYLSEIAQLYLKNQAMSETSIYARMLEILALLNRNYQLPFASDEVGEITSYHSRYNKQMMEICGYISIHCSENLKLDNVAMISGFSKYYFERIFKQYTGSSFYQYLTQKRISMAEKLLVDSESTITDIAYRSGFSSSTAFTRAFKLAKQFTPSEFRLLHKSNDQLFVNQGKRQISDI